jgi:hypothetical protein
MTTKACSIMLVLQPALDATKERLYSMDQVKSTGRAFASGILTAAMTHKKYIGRNNKI